MVSIAAVGLGKMGISHLAILGGLPGIDVVGVCDSMGYLRDVLRKNTKFPTFSDYERMLTEAAPDAVVISTPTGSHFSMVRTALERGIHVFCEKPLTLDADESEALERLAAERGLVAQTGYHNRFVASFAEVKRLLTHGTLGRISHVLAEAYGPVVLRTKGTTWRSKRTQGGGCLYDYAAHPLDLLNWYFGEADVVRGSQLLSVFSAETEDVVVSTLGFPGGPSAQLSVDWSDESCRKMTTRITIWGEHGKVQADRQEIQVFIRSTALVPDGYEAGQNVKYTTELTEQVDFYLRGEEYSAQVAHFADCVSKSIRGASYEVVSDLSNAAATDRMIAQIIADASGSEGVTAEVTTSAKKSAASSVWKRFGRREASVKIS